MTKTKLSFACTGEGTSPGQNFHRIKVVIYDLKNDLYEGIMTHEKGSDQGSYDQVWFSKSYRYRCDDLEEIEDGLMEYNVDFPGKRAAIRSAVYDAQDKAAETETT